MPTTPIATYPDGLTIGQLASQWDTSHEFVRRMVAEGKLVQDERGVILNAALHDFMRQHSAELD